MSRGLGKVEQAVLVGAACPSHRLDDALVIARRSLGMEAETAASRVTLSRAMSSLRRKGLVRTGWQASNWHDRRVRWIEPTHKARPAKTARQYVAEVERLSNRLELLLDQKLRDMANQELAPRSVVSLGDILEALRDAIDAYLNRAR